MRENHEDTKTTTTSESPAKAVIKPEFKAATRFRTEFVKQGDNRDEQELKKIASVTASDFEG